MKHELPKTYELRKLVASGTKLTDQIRPFEKVLLRAPIFMFTGHDMAAVSERTLEDIAVPYPECVFEVEVHNESYNECRLYIMAKRSDGYHIHVAFKESSGGWKSYATVLGKNAIFHGTWKTDTDSVAAFVLLQVCVGCLLINSHKVEKFRTPLLRRQTMAGPGIVGWDYHVVTLDPDKLIPPRQDPIGTHASPRWHLRRSHERRLRSGKTVQVRSCEVGDKTLGGVVKDYAVVPGSTSTH